MKICTLGFGEITMKIKLNILCYSSYFWCQLYFKFTKFFIAYPEILVVCLLEFLIQLNFCTNFNNYFIKLMILLRKILKKFIYFRVIIKGMSRGDEHRLRICDLLFNKPNFSSSLIVNWPCSTSEWKFVLYFPF